MSSIKEYPYYMTIYLVYNKGPVYFETDQGNCSTFPVLIFKRMEK